MFKKTSQLTQSHIPPITVIAFLFLFVFANIGLVGVADAIDVIVGSSSGCLNYGFTGDTLYSQVDCSEPYRLVYWYVKAPGDTGAEGTLVEMDYGDGTSESSHFSYTFDSGSTTGEEYKITAYVYSANNVDINQDSYTVTVWAPPEEVITMPDELTITSDIKIGDSYAFVVEASSSSSNYVIDAIEVLVDGVSVVLHNVYGVTNTLINVSGNLPAPADDMMTVETKITGFLKSGGKIIGAIALKQIWRAILRTSLWGDCECAVDNNPLDNKEDISFFCWVENGSGSQGRWEEDTRFNTTIVEWKVLKASNFFMKKSGKDFTNDAGRYVFSHEIPIGYLINVTLKSDDLHWHGDGDSKVLRICKYEATEEAVDTGTVILEVIPKEWFPTIQKNFSLNPNSLHDPCDNKYP